MYAPGTEGKPLGTIGLL